MYDLISINSVDIPDVKKGTLTIAPNQKYNEYETEDGGKVIEVIAADMLKGSVSYNGLTQSEMQTISAAINLVSQMTVYNPFTNNTKTFTALITVNQSDKILHDATANAWTYSFNFEEIGGANGT